jgi:hypothetical protein
MHASGKIGCARTYFRATSMGESAQHRHLRHLIALVVEFARMPWPLDSRRVLRHFAGHSWFTVPVPAPRPTTASVIFGTTTGTVPLGPMSFAVESLGQFGSLNCGSPSPSSAGDRRVAWPGSVVVGPLIEASAFASDHSQLRRLLHDLWAWDGTARRRVADWRVTIRAASPDLARYVSDENGTPQRWLAGVAGACFVAVDALASSSLRRTLRYCAACAQPWWPPSDKRGRPPSACPACGGEMPRAAR